MRLLGQTGVTNRLLAIPTTIPYRNPRFDENGQLLHRKPTVHGQQTAIVVGPPGQVIHTDRNHRIKVQFHWQRGDRSHNRLPSTRLGHSGAPANEQSGTWVRVMTSLAPIAGAKWGSHSIPRIGQEVLIDFLEGDIDRPVAIASLYNGKGQLNAQHNQISQGGGVSTGNAPTWFPGQLDGHAHKDGAPSLSALAGERIPIEQLHLSRLGEEFIKEYEKLRLDCYEDSFGYCTVGWGHLTGGKTSCASQGLSAGVTITEAEAQVLFDRDKDNKQVIVKRSITAPLYQHEYDALCSLAFNIGSLSRKAPSLCRKVNAGDYAGGAAEFLDITNGGLTGLVKRRKQENAMFLTAKYDSAH